MNEFPGAYSIPAFCTAFGGMTRQHFHAIQKAGKGPRTFTVGRRRLISHDAATEWIRRLEAETAQESQ